MNYVMLSKRTIQLGILFILSGKKEDVAAYRLYFEETKWSKNLEKM